MTRSAAARAEVADFDRARNGASALIARLCSMMDDVMFDGLGVRDTDLAWIWK